jgi:hypothetical protein
MQIIDSAFPLSVFEKIQEIALSPNTMWTWQQETDIVETNLITGWKSIIAQLSSNNSYLEVYNKDLYNIVSTALACILEKFDQEFDHILTMRLLLNTASPAPHNTGAHVDIDTKHMTAILYINDSDGSTIIYKNKYLPMLNEGSASFKKRNSDKFEVKEEIKPKSNRLVIFDGLHYHAGTLPVATAKRILLNVNYTIKQ